MIERMKNAIKGENGGPMIDNLVGIAVALIFVIALGTLACVVISWLGNATGAVSSLHNNPTP
jgi:hypothetical protein